VCGVVLNSVRCVFDWKTYILYSTISEGLLLHVAYLVCQHVLLEVTLQMK